MPKNLALHKRPALREIAVGLWEKKSWGEIARSWPQEMQDFARHLDRWSIPGAETPAQVRDRVTAAVRQIARENPERTAAVFSHGYALRILLGTLEGLPLSEIGQTPHGDNTAVSLLEGEGETLRVVFRDDSTHLSAAGQPLRRRATALEPGLFFAPLALPEQAAFLRRCVSQAWADGGEQRPLDETRLLRDAAARPTILGELRQGPAGLLQLCPEREAQRRRGWISLCCTDRSLRAQGYGVQLVGQAVEYYRPLGREFLCVALRERNPARKFFADYGFLPTGEQTPDGRSVLCKDLRFRPLQARPAAD